MRFRVGGSSNRATRHTKAVFVGLALLVIAVLANVVVVTVAVWPRVGETRFAILLAALWVITLVALALLYRGWRHAKGLVRSRAAGVA